MSEIKLSILIATMPSRGEQFLNLWADVAVKQIISNAPLNNVEVLYDNSMDYNIGTKRNKLLSMANGEYIVFIDDDDTISPSYVSEILSASKSSPDCIGINGTITTNGHNKRQWFISKGYGNWHEANGVYYRTPNHISPVKRELALQVGFPEISFAEDAEYSRRLLPLLKTETLITQPIYHYDYWENK